MSNLTVTTPSDLEVVITRTFDAPARMVFDAHTKPELVKKWLQGYHGWSLSVCKIDLRVGGKYRYEWKHEDGRGMGMGGSFREIGPPSRLVTTELFDEDWTGGETVVNYDFREVGGKTHMTMTVVYASKEGRDGALATGMTEGMEYSYGHLDTLLAAR